MINRLKKWKWNRKLSKELQSKNIRYYKIEEYIEQGADFGKILKYINVSNFKMRELKRFAIIKKQSTLFHPNMLKKIENAFYKNFFSRTLKDVDQYLILENKAELKEGLADFSIEIDYQRVDLLTTLAEKENELRNFIENKTLMIKIRDWFAFNKFKDIKEKNLIKEIAILKNEEYKKSLETLKNINNTSPIKNKKILPPKIEVSEQSDSNEMIENNSTQEINENNNQVSTDTTPTFEQSKIEVSEQTNSNEVIEIISPQAISQDNIDEETEAKINNAAETSIVESSNELSKDGVWTENLKNDFLQESNINKIKLRGNKKSDLAQPVIKVLEQTVSNEMLQINLVQEINEDETLKLNTTAQRNEIKQFQKSDKILEWDIKNLRRATNQVKFDKWYYGNTIEKEKEKYNLSSNDLIDLDELSGLPSKLNLQYDWNISNFQTEENLAFGN